jgi:uncharacterized membrane protein YqjE
MADNQTQTQDERSISELMRDLSQQSTALMRQELELAKAELREKGKTAGVGAGMFGTAGLLALFGVGALTACVVLALATAMDAWLAALIVGAVYLAAAGVAALVGRAKIEEATPPAPEQAIESTKEDVQWTKQRAQAARQ